MNKRKEIKNSLTLHAWTAIKGSWEFIPIISASITGNAYFSINDGKWEQILPIVHADVSCTSKHGSSFICLIKKGRLFSNISSSFDVSVGPSRMQPNESVAASRYLQLSWVIQLPIKGIEIGIISSAIVFVTNVKHAEAHFAGFHSSS